MAADGSFLPPLIVFKGAGIQARWTSEETYPGTLYSVSKNWWMEELQFYTWFTQDFISHIKKLREAKQLPNQAAVLLYDGHASHISVRIIEEVIANNITLIKLPSHLTNMLQTLDKCVFGPVKTSWEKKLIAFGKKQMGKGTGRLSKSDFVKMLGEVWSDTFKQSNIICGFRSCRIFPVDETKFPRDAFKKEDLEAYLQRHTNSTETPKQLTAVSNTVNNSLPPKDKVTSDLQDKNNICSHLHNDARSSKCTAFATGQETNYDDINVHPSATSSDTSIQKLFFLNLRKKAKALLLSKTQMHLQ